MKTLSLTLTAVVAAFALAGCASKVKLDDKAPVEDRTASPVGAGGAGGAGAAGAQSRVVPVDTASTQNTSNLGRVVYFDFDSYVVKEDYRGLVEGYAKMLSTDPRKKLQIEGHTDERGGREYNLALGQKRAEAVARSLTLLGAKDTQIESVSFGKERPVAMGSDESAWAKNRRAELASR